MTYSSDLQQLYSFCTPAGFLEANPYMTSMALKKQNLRWGLRKKVLEFLQLISLVLMTTELLAFKSLQYGVSENALLKAFSAQH